MAIAIGQQVYLAVVETLMQRIAAGDWQPGQRVPSITQLARELGVSTGPVREAARVLASRGLLRIEHGRGIFVTDAPNLPLDLYEHFQRMDTGSLLELFEARRLHPRRRQGRARRARDRRERGVDGAHHRRRGAQAPPGRRHEPVVQRWAR